MAGDWIKVELELPDKPEVHYMAGILNLDCDAVVGKLLRVWGWFDKHTVDGNAKSPSSIVDQVARTTGFADAMVAAGWLTIGDGLISVPNFDKHNSVSAKTRGSTAARVAAHRSRNAGVTKKQTQESYRTCIPRPVRQAVIDRDGNTCVYCDRPAGKYAPPEIASDAVIAIDHVIPLAQGGSNEINNLVCACMVCNLFKSDRTPEEAGLKWPTDETGEKRGCNAKVVTNALPREEKRREVNKGQAFALPDWVPAESWRAYLDMRHKSRKDPTERAKELVVQELGKLKAAGESLEAVLDQSTMRGWTDVYPVKAKAAVTPMDAFRGMK